jgi:hypothetical protein
MSYFRNVPFVPYRFGTSEEVTLHQDLGAYVDLVDQIRDNASFYKKYTIIDGDRPDNLSYKLYGSTKYYWTFFLMNEGLRERGWPLTNQQLLELVQSERDDTVLTTRDDLTGIFNIGSVVTGVTSGISGTIIGRRLELGQLIIRGDLAFSPTEQITTTENEVLRTIRLVGRADQFEAVWQYEDSDGRPVDVNPYTEPGAQFAAVSYYDRYVRDNDELKDIVIIKPSVIDAVFEQFQAAMSDT